MRKNLLFLRAAIPPWQDLNDPLLRHELRQNLRTGRRPWTAIFLGYGLMFCVILYLLYMLYDLEQSPYGRAQHEEVLGGMLGWLALALIALNTIGHWRLLLAITRRAAGMIAARRIRGDWDLIAIAPVEKSRWYRAQTTALCWQVWPITRQLVLAQTLLMLILFGICLYGLNSESDSNDWADESCSDWENGVCVEYASSGYLPLPVYALAFVPFGLLMACFPMVESALYASASLYPSSRARNSLMSMLYSFIAIYLVRVVMMVVFFYGGLLMLYGLNQLRMGGNDFDMPDAEALALLVFYGSLGIIGAAFGIEWVPFLSPLVLLNQGTVKDHLLIYVWLLLTFGLAYVVVPLVMIRLFSSGTIRRLDKPEK
jgi:hypothetical protein